MSRNPYLAASRPSSSFTRSSRTSSRATGGSGASGLLGRSRSSAALGGLGSQLNASSYSSAALGISSHYVPSSNWHRSSSSTRQDTSSTSPAVSSRLSSTSNNRRELVEDADMSSRSLRSICKSGSSHGLSSREDTDNDVSEHNQSESQDYETHLKNYQQSKLNQHPQPSRPSTRSLTRSSLQSLDSDNASTDNNNNNIYSSRATSRQSSTASLDSSSSFATGNDDFDDSIIGDNIPSASARHLRQQQQQHGLSTNSSSLLSKSKSLEISSTSKRTGDYEQDSSSPILFSSMSVDRLLLRADSMGERDLRKSFKELVMENERLKQQVKGFDDKDKQRQQDWIRQERKLHRRISELEEENKQIEHWKQEIQRLKDENNSLIRVVSKLSKQP